VNIYPFIEAERAEHHNVARGCELLKVSKSAFYQQRNASPSARQLRDIELKTVIVDIHTESRATYGAPRVHAELRARGIHCAKKRVARLMVQAGLIGRCRRSFRKTTIQDPTARPTAVDLIARDFSIGEINRRWCGDITYIQTWEGWVYLATVIDIGSRRVVGWAIADHLRTELVSGALDMARWHRKPDGGVIFHADRGCQYTSKEFSELLNGNTITLSLGRRGQCWDNAVAESFFATLKGELIDRYTWPTKSSVRTAIFDYIEGWYNLRRRHSTLGLVSPAEYETSLRGKQSTNT